MGSRFEKLICNFLKTDPIYKNIFKDVFLWNEFEYKKQFSLGGDVGIDIVALTFNDEYWAIQCKCYQESSYISKENVDTFLSTLDKKFKDKFKKEISFQNGLFIATTNNFSQNAIEAIKNRTLPVQLIKLSYLENVDIDWQELDKGLFGSKLEINKKELRPHQKQAIEKTKEYFSNEKNTRGKLIMACGTGKTFTSLKIAEELTNNKGLILYLVPTISLINQTLIEWSSQATNGINAICICSDENSSKNISKDDDSNIEFIEELALPASTKTDNILKQFKHIEIRKDIDNMLVVFSTYQSIETIANAQKELLKQDKDKYIFDLIICDESHRTTGVVLTNNKNETDWTKVHNSEFLLAKKRIYMTATPKIYSSEVKQKVNEAKQQKINNNNEIDVICSMDDAEIYGEEIYRLGFGEAVDKGLLSDYKVICLVNNSDDDFIEELANDIDLDSINEEVVRITADKTKVKQEDIAKLISCIKALSKNLIDSDIKEYDPEPMKKALAFCHTIKESKATSILLNELGKKIKNISTDEYDDINEYISMKQII